MNQFQVTLTESSEEKGFGASLGIPVERFEVISDHMASITSNENNAHKALAQCTTIAENANELAFISFCIGAQVQGRKNPVTELLEAILSR